MVPGGGALEWLKETDNLETESLRTRLRDSTSSLLHQYAELLRAAQVHDRVHQQVGELQSSVLAEGVVLATENLMRLTDELRRADLLGNHSGVRADVAASANVHESTAATGESRLKRVTGEMQAALHEMELNYYGCSVQGSGGCA